MPSTSIDPSSCRTVLRSRHVIPKCGHLAGRITRSHVTNARVIKLRWNYAVRFRVSNPDSRTMRLSTLIVYGWKISTPVESRRFNLIFSSSNARTNSQIRVFIPNSPRSVMLILFFSCSSCLTGKLVLIIGLNLARNFLTNVISKLLTVSLLGLSLLECQVREWRFIEVISNHVVDSFALISQTPRLTRENSFYIKFLPTASG